jgi:hypothetical protein
MIHPTPIQTLLTTTFESLGFRRKYWCLDDLGWVNPIWWDDYRARA